MSSCAYCGTEGEDVETHSGVEECRDCWYWRKLNGPAARFWANHAGDVLANIDVWDTTRFFPAAGLTREETHAMIEALAKLRDYSRAQLTEHSPASSV